MLRLVVIAAVLVWLLPATGGMVGGAIETGYEVRDSNTRLAVATARATGAEIVTASEYADAREAR